MGWKIVHVQFQCNKSCSESDFTQKIVKYQICSYIVGTTTKNIRSIQAKLKELWSKVRFGLTCQKKFGSTDRTANQFDPNFD